LVRPDPETDPDTTRAADPSDPTKDQQYRDYFISKVQLFPRRECPECTDRLLMDVYISYDPSMCGYICRSCQTLYKWSRRKPDKLEKKGIAIIKGYGGPGEDVPI
jgi:hypothetical protein